MNLFKEKYYLDNNLFDANFIDTLDRSIDDFNTDISDKFDEIKKLWNKEKFKKSKEATLEVEFIHPLFKLLGYEFIYRERISFQGQSYEPDNTLFRDKEHKEAFEKNKSALENILLFCESKGYKEKLDTKSKDKRLNPHYQLLHYLKTFKIDYGFLTNGHIWRFYDNSVVSTSKTYYEIDLEVIIESDDLEAFRYFYFIFRKDNFYVENEKISHEIVEKNNSVKTDVETDLKNVIYGTDRRESIFEIIGKSIYEADPNKSLYDVYGNTLYLVFRLLFIAYFEDKNKKLLELHRYYNDISLNTLYEKLEDPSNQQDDRFNFYGDIKRLFRILNEGNESYEIPLFNGGLFNPKKAPLLENGRLLSNKQLFSILNSLLIFDYGNSLFRRDFKNLSIINLGSIYEGLLEYRFEVAQDDLYYIEYKSTKKSTKIITGYMDTYDYENIKSNYITKENYYQTGEIYLTNSSNSRKSTASYYTPTSLSSFMVKSAIDLEINKGKKPIEIKILDNACGSGHFLLESLAYLTDQAIIGLEEDIELQNMIENERVKIQANLIGFDEKIEIGDYDIVKRLLLKKTIFGVDLNPFSVELTKLALWIDSFIFGTPLSFLAHHIKQGNSLMGSRIEEFNVYFPKSDGLFQNNFIEEFEKLNDVYETLNNIQDTTADEINTSKKQYEEVIQPKLDKLNMALNLVTLIKLKTVMKDTKEIANIKVDTALVEKIFDNHDDKLMDTIKAYAKKYSFFNYEIEFPEMTHKQGFDIIVGNPPWDVVKLDDKDFFSQYRSNYRTLTINEKRDLQMNLLSIPKIKEKYLNSKRYYALIQKYFKLIYKKSAGVGNNQNFFRFFIEQNLSLLTKSGNLTYLTPSAIISEDGSAKLREYIFNYLQWNYAYSFENREKHFPAVDSRFKYVIFQIENKHSVQKYVKTKFMLQSPKTLYLEENIINYNLDALKKLSPGYLAFLEFQSIIDLSIIQKIYNMYPVFTTDYLALNSEDINLTRGKYLFHEEKPKNPICLYEGKMFWQFNSQHKKPSYYLNYTEFKNHKESIELSHFINNIYIDCSHKLETKTKTVLKVLKLSSKEELKKFLIYDSEYFRLGIRLISSNTNERTLIASILPKKIAAGHSIIISYPKKYILKNNEVNIKQITSLKILFLNAMFNSFIVDYVLRFLTDMAVNKTYLTRLPLPQPSEEELQTSTQYQQLIINSLKLTLYYNFDDFKELADEYRLTQNDLPTTDKQVDMLKIENDIIVAKMYDIEYEELKHILSTFKVFNKKYPAYVNTLLSQYKSERG